MDTKGPTLAKHQEEEPYHESIQNFKKHDRQSAEVIHEWVGTISPKIFPIHDDQTRLNPSSKFDDDNINTLKLLLKYFELSSSLKVNTNKTSIIHVSENSEVTRHIEDTLDCSVGTLPPKYLGIPLRIGPPLKEDWRRVNSEVDTILARWKGYLLSRAGRLVLTNSVQTNQTFYLFSIFEASKWVIRQIDKRRQTFLWIGHGENNLRSKCLVN
ncbi:hypothetical protein Cni_G16240 [Canna indica]|uniref:Reverse transcriptase n=1 Tax=Canna indica TaxID=4628 RepID=A0AAQ3QFP8_9LILI|nr:hypothetical protein Cni_G16240 [Canna indica]